MMSRLFFGVILIAACVLCLQASASSADVKAIEAWFGKVKTAQARFIQTNNDGTQNTGIFYLSRPGKLRFTYDPPIKDFIVADGAFIYFYDSQMEQQSNAPIGTTLADFLLRKNFTLSGDLQVQDMHREGGYLQTTLVQSNDPQAGKLMLAFTEKPLLLRKWRVVDPQGIITEVELTNFQEGVAFPKGFFTYHDPNQKRGTYNE